MAADAAIARTVHAVRRGGRNKIVLLLNASAGAVPGLTDGAAGTNDKQNV
jgi:hypothetical protein